MTEPKVTLIIKSTVQQNFTLQVSPVDTLALVHQRLSEEYFGNPRENDQTLIYAGKVLKDKSVKIQDVVGQHDSSAGSGPYNLHLVVKQSLASSVQSPPPAQHSAASVASGSSCASQQPAASPAPASASRKTPPPPPPLPPAPKPIPTHLPLPVHNATSNEHSSAYNEAHNSAFTQTQVRFVHHPAPSPIPQVETSTTHHNPYIGLNPVMARAYDAAYNAALAVAKTAAGQADTHSPSAINPQQQLLVQMNGQTYTLVPLHMYQQSAATASHLFASPGQLGGHGLHPSLFSTCNGAGGASSSSSATAQAGVTTDPVTGAAPADAAQAMRFLQADLAAQLAVLARRSARVRLHPRRGERPAVGGAEGAAAQQNALQAEAAGVPRGMLGREVRRVFLLRIPLTTRTLLQLLVFAVVLYQHFTWQRFLALVIGGIVFYLTAVWTPLRRMMVALMHGTPRTAQQAGQHPAAPVAQNRGLLSEVMIFLAGFITSLLPAWNYNPDEAAGHVAEQQQQQQPADAGAAGAAAAAQPAAEPPPLADEVPAL